MKNEKQAIRSWRLYDFLMECYRDSMLHSKFISKEEIARALPTYYNVFDKSTRYLREIESDVEFLNTNLDPTQHIIVSNKDGYKIASLEDYKEYILKRKEYLAKYAKRTKLIEQKYQMALNEPTLFDV